MLTFKPENILRLEVRYRKVPLVGPPGTGKPYLLKLREQKYIFNCSLVEIVGVGASRPTYSSAKDKSPAIIFIDEIDAVASER